jgi:hypothetical protein
MENGEGRGLLFFLSAYSEDHGFYPWGSIKRKSETIDKFISLILTADF